MDLGEKLSILAAAAKFDASCASSGSGSAGNGGTGGGLRSRPPQEPACGGVVDLRIMLSLVLVMGLLFTGGPDPNQPEIDTWTNFERLTMEKMV